jgi:N-acetylglucosamine kinase-like BadF-type ATPase
VSVLLAVDGGNSKTAAALLDSSGTVLGTARGPGSSPHRLGVEGSLDVLQALVEELGGELDLAVLMLAAVDFPDEEAAYREAADRRGWASETVVGNDTFAVLRAGSERGFGVAVTCGAGINCVGVAPDGRTVRFPSLGRISGDWGGGGDVGPEALYAASRSEDGRGPKTVLERQVPEHFGFATPIDLARALIDGDLDHERLADLTPIVFAAAEQDAVAAAIVDRLADEIVAMVRATVTRLEIAEQEVDIVLGGGLLQAGNGRLLGRIHSGVLEVGPLLTVHVASHPPVVGAALIALDRVGAGRDAQARLRSAFS